MCQPSENGYTGGAIIAPIFAKFAALSTVKLKAEAVSSGADQSKNDDSVERDAEEVVYRRTATLWYQLALRIVFERKGRSAD